MLSALIKTMRPKQWTKNIFVLAGIFFDGRLSDPVRLLHSIAALAIFCVLSGAIYLVNDLVDIDNDRVHPKKRFRPLPSDELEPSVAKVAAVILLVGCIAASFALGMSFGLVAVLYGAMMVLYSFVLKHIVIVDVMTIAAGFVLRVLAGAVAADVTRFSPWLYVCTTLLALFIAINKRRHELILMAHDANNHRALLQEYTVPFLNEMTALVTSTTLAAYSFYTFSAPNLPGGHPMMLTIPFVLYGILRYLYLIHTKGLGGAPEDIVLGDKPMMIAIGLWALTAGLVIYGSRLI
jgi:4-hydroxybenzoate polyprenyltransferase